MNRPNNQGFTLIEVMITIGIILVLSVALASLLRSNLDIRAALSERALVNHRLSVAMQRVIDDLQHSFMIADDDLFRYGDVTKRKWKPYFKIDIVGESSELWLTSFSNRPLKRNSAESDLALVVYKLKDATNAEGRTHLYRGKFKIIPDRLAEEPPMQVLAQDIKTFKVQAWRGDEWLRDRWDSTNRTYRNKMPHMVQVDIEAWSINSEDAKDEGIEIDDIPVVKLSSVAFLQLATDLKELKPRSASIRWDRLAN